MATPPAVAMQAPLTQSSALILNSPGILRIMPKINRIKKTTKIKMLEVARRRVEPAFLLGAASATDGRWVRAPVEERRGSLTARHTT